MSNRFENTAREFPDFDLSTLPAIPAEWVDSSWHNDTCPSFKVADMLSDNGGEGMYVYVDYSENQRDRREFPEVETRFSVVMINQDGTTEEVISTNDWNAVLVACANVTDEATSRDFLKALFTAGLAYHPDDSAADCLSSHGLSEPFLNRIQVSVHETFDHVDPSAVILELLNKES